MKNKKILKIIVIVFVIFLLFLIFMFRVTIHNKILSNHLEQILSKSTGNPDYQLILLHENNVPSSEGEYYQKFEKISIFLEKNKILYDDMRNTKKVPFIFGSATFYRKSKVVELKQDTLNLIEKYKVKRYESYFNLHAFDEEFKYSGDVVLYNIPEAYLIPSSSATELQQLFEQIRNSE